MNIYGKQSSDCFRTSSGIATKFTAKYQKSDAFYIIKRRNIYRVVIVLSAFNISKRIFLKFCQFDLSIASEKYGETQSTFN